ncbi:MAG TPA: hypothetical protein VGM88_13800 [Kofleriaceae bacterium]
MRAALVLAVLAGCTSFPDPQIVVDLRCIGITAEPAEALVEVGPDHMLPAAAELIDEVERQKPTVCATIADPGQNRDVRWSALLCRLDDGDRCDPAAPTVQIGGGLAPDPESSIGGEIVDQVCVTVEPATNAAVLAQILQVELAANPAEALSGVPYGVEFHFGAPDGAPADDLVAAKRINITPDLPVGRTPNQNPTITGLQFSFDGATFITVAAAQCSTADHPLTAPIYMPTEDSVTLYPNEGANAHEMYFAATLDGGFETETETLTYQWLGTDGSFSDETTGGGKDPFGNAKLLGTQWSRPSDADPGSRIQVWIVQRDERGGSSVFPVCVVLAEGP